MEAYRDRILRDPSTDPPRSAYKAPGSLDRIVDRQILGQIPGYPGIRGWIRSALAFTRAGVESVNGNGRGVLDNGHGSENNVGRVGEEGGGKGFRPEDSGRRHSPAGRQWEKTFTSVGSTTATLRLPGQPGQVRVCTLKRSREERVERVN